MKLKQIIGGLPASDSLRARRARIHQGWWRAFVLNLAPGLNPITKLEPVCSRLPSDGDEKANFISTEIGSLALKVAQDHNDSPEKSGIIEIDRLKTNLLSSQPLCFNFFGLIALDKELGLKVIKTFYPEVEEFHGVLFEYAPSPKQKFTNDNSAFDVAIEVSIGGKKGLIGFECKYTESFSEKEYDQPRYREIFAASKVFVLGYEALKASRFNQLFRNQLIAESIIQDSKCKYKFVKTALFCAPDDEKAKATATEFAKGLTAEFKTIDFMEYITAIQRQDISSEQRHLSMILWARYLAYELSAAAETEIQ